jgi:hypothetical protein
MGHTDELGGLKRRSQNENSYPLTGGIMFQTHRKEAMKNEKTRCVLFCSAPVRIPVRKRFRTSATGSRRLLEL